MSTLHIDFETRSAIDLKKTGVYVYADDPSTDIWCACYALGDGEVKVWTPGQPVPPEIIDQVMEGGTFTAHNAAFERTIWRYILAPRYGWPEPDVTQWRDTMVLAYAMSLPGSLDQAAPAAGLDICKDAAGYRLMLQMSKPRRVKGKTDLIWWDDPEKRARLIAYCKTDVEVERALEKRLRPLKSSELDLWHLDQRINDRGIYVDEDLCLKAKKIVAKVEAEYDAEIQKLTEFAVTAASNVNEIVRYIKSHGIDADSVAKDQVEELLGRDDLPPTVRRVLEIRKGAARTSVTKIDALLRGMNKDRRARGLLQFHAAGTGRWAGRRFQPQNLKRPSMDIKEISDAISILRSGDGRLFGMVYDDPLDAVSDCIRGMVSARPGRRIVACDYSNIEGRVLAWLAGEEWKLGAFRAYDDGTGHDLYKITAGGILGKAPEDVTKSERQAYGKVPELALGYQGGVGAFQTMAVNYGVHLPTEEVERIRDGWREKHPRIKNFWYDLEAASIDALESGQKVNVGKIAFKKSGSFLFMRLPSGRMLAYAYPRMVEKEMPWKDDNGKPVKKWVLAYMGTNSYTRKWELCYSYGGLLAENATQAVARDILADSLPRIEAAGYPIVLTVHDEVVAEVPIGHGSLDDMCRIMATLPDWAEGCPVSVAGFEAERYGK